MWTFNRSELQPHLDEGHIREVVHPNGALKLYNYTAKCQYESVWTPVTKACRGLIVDNSDNVIAEVVSRTGQPCQIRQKDAIVA